jgi:hypothetical protein
MGWLIPYTKLDPPDPLLAEVTYGDVGTRGRKMLSEFSKGDYVFFHTSRGRQRYITAYYVVDRVLETAVAAQDRAIRAKYRNPHLLDWLNGSNPPRQNDAILFGDPITSRVLDRPLLFDKELAQRLSLNIPFAVRFTETQAISSATRQWRRLSDSDIDTLLTAIELAERRPVLSQLYSSEEVAETIEQHIESFIAANPALIGPGLSLTHRQWPRASGRLDLLLEDEHGDMTVVEVKYGWLGRDALRQVRTYVDELRASNVGRSVKGVLVGAGVMPAYQEDFKRQHDIQVFVFGWTMQLQAWDED